MLNTCLTGQQLTSRNSALLLLLVSDFLFLPSAEQTIDMGFPGAGLLVSSCQYTMVPLRAISAPRANGHPYVNGQPYANGAHLNGICPSAGVGYASTKPRDYSPDMQQVWPHLQLTADSTLSWRPWLHWEVCSMQKCPNWLLSYMRVPQIPRMSRKVSKSLVMRWFPGAVALKVRKRQWAKAALNGNGSCFS